MTDAAFAQPELPIEHPDDEQVALRAAYRTVRIPRCRSFEDAMSRPTLAIAIRNLAHARRKKVARR